MNVLVIALDAAVPLDVPEAEVLVVAPALNTPAALAVGQRERARRAAEVRLAACLDRLERTAAHARGSVGDADPVQAIADALATFPADEIVIVGHPERSRPHARDLTSRARERFAVPISDAEAMPNAA
jgi:hypothetical protein